MSNRTTEIDLILRQITKRSMVHSCVTLLFLDYMTVVTPPGPAIGQNVSHNLHFLSEVLCSI